MTSTLYNNIKRLVTKYFEDKDTEDVTLPQWFEDNIFHLNGKIYVEENPFDRAPLEFTFEGTELTQYSGGSFDGEDMIIDYGDGTIERTGGRFGHTYSENGTYQVKIYGVTSLGNSCFYRCAGLISITIPNSVTSLGTSCFNGCSSLTSITILDGVTNLRASCFRNCTGLTSVTIPNSVTNLEDYCFYGCTGLTSIIIPNNVISLGAQCFYHCTGLTSITIPDNVTTLGSYCFRGCSSLISITIPNSVTSIGAYCFATCANLTSIRLNWTGTDILTYKSGWIMDTNSALKFSIPLSTTTQYIDKSYPSSKLVESD